MWAWLDLYKVHILAGGYGVLAALVTAYVMRRLDDGRVRGLGAAFGMLALLLLGTIASVDELVADAGMPLQRDGPYEAAFIVLIAGGVLWLVSELARGFEQIPRIEKGHADRLPHSAPVLPAPPRRIHRSAALLALIASGAVLAVLWIIAVSLSPPSGVTRETVSLWLTPMEFLAQAAGTGLLAMATIQGVRTIVPVRGAFHRAALIRWIDESVKGKKAVTVAAPATAAMATAAAPADGGGASAPSPPKTSKRAAAHAANARELGVMLGHIAQLASPASGEHHYALFDLPIEQLCGQIAAGADRLLDTGVVPAPAIQSSAASATEGASANAPTLKASDILGALAASPSDIVSFLDMSGRSATAEGDSREVSTREARDRMRLRAIISQRIQQNIDRLQIDTTFWWRRLLRGLAVTICLVLGLTLLSGSVSAVVFAIVGGFVATVARDLVAIVEKARR